MGTPPDIPSAETVPEIDVPLAAYAGSTAPGDTATSPAARTPTVVPNPPNDDAASQWQQQNLNHETFPTS